MTMLILFYKILNIHVLFNLIFADTVVFMVAKREMPLFLR